jgi:transcriptional regulator with XRE-family HTH domain
MIFGEWLKSTLKSKKLSQIKLANFLSNRGHKVTAQHVNKWCKGEYEPNRKHLEEIYNFLEVRYPPSGKDEYKAKIKIDKKDRENDNSDIPNKISKEDTMSETQKDRYIALLEVENKRLNARIAELEDKKSGKTKRQGRQTS